MGAKQNSRNAVSAPPWSPQISTTDRTHARTVHLHIPPCAPRTPQSTPRLLSMFQRTAGGLVRCPRGQHTRPERTSGTPTRLFSRTISAFAVRTCVLCAQLGRPMLLSLGTLAVPAPSFPEANSAHATHAFLSLQFIAAPTMTDDAHHDGMACAPRAGPNLVAAKVPLMLNPPRRRAHDGAPSASRRPRLRRPLRRHLRRQRPRWWRPQRGAAAAARRAGWRCGYRVRYTRRS